MVAIHTRINDMNELIYWHHPESECVGICESEDLFEKMVREEPVLEEITEELYIKLKKMYEE
jgi:hypothetical protein